MRRLFVYSLAVMAFASGAHGQTTKSQELCGVLMPKVLELVTIMEKLPESFDVILGQMAVAEQVKFADVTTSGNDLAVAARDYRAAFLKACYE